MSERVTRHITENESDDSYLLHPNGDQRIQYSNFVNSSQYSIEDLYNTDENNRLTNSYQCKSNNANNVNENRFTFRSLCTRRYFSLFLLGYGIFWCSSCYALIAPFFPKEAKKKGMSATLYGFVFGEFQFIIFIMSPIFGKIMPIVTPRFFSIYGLLVSGSCSILFGVISMSPNGAPFIALAFVVRIFEAIGTSAFYVSALTIAVEEFPNNRGFVASIIESMAGIGMIVGPTIGGLLFTAGGYMLPFVTLGGIILLGWILIPFVIAVTHVTDQTSPSLFLLLKNPTFYLQLSIFIYCFMLIGFNEATLGTHLDQFHFSPSVTGLIFGVPALFYAIGTPLWGYVSDKIDRKILLCLFGIAVCSISFLLIGPVPFIPIKTQFWMVIVALVLLGIGVSGSLIPCFLLCLSNAIRIGYPDNVATYGLITGIFTSMSALGAFIGPSVGGVMLDTIGYINATLIFFCLSLVVMVETLIYSIISLRRGRRSEETEAILDN